MKTNQLKKIIKQLVKESLNEVLLENYVNSTVKKAINEHMLKLSSTQPKSHSKPLNENITPKPQPKKTPPIISEQRRKELLSKIVGNDDGSDHYSQPAKKMDQYSDIFEDTINSDHPLITGEDTGRDDPSGPVKQIPEEVLEQSGLMDKDWSRYF